MIFGQAYCLILLWELDRLEGIMIESTILHSGGRKEQGHLPKYGHPKFRSGGGKRLRIIGGFVAACKSDGRSLPPQKTVP
jgi:hypothetical protein